MKFKSQTKFSLFLFIGFLSILVEGKMAQTADLKGEVTIVAYDAAATRKSRPSFIGDEKYYVAKVLKTLSGDVGSDYILILTGQRFEKSSFNIDRMERLDLIRAKGCDDMVRNRFYFSDSAGDKIAKTRLLFSKGVRREDVPLEITLPCYLFRGNNFRTK